MIQDSIIIPDVLQSIFEYIPSNCFTAIQFTTKSWSVIATKELSKRNTELEVLRSDDTSSDIILWYNNTVRKLCICEIGNICKQNNLNLLYRLHNMIDLTTINKREHSCCFYVCKIAKTALKNNNTKMFKFGMLLDPHPEYQIDDDDNLCQELVYRKMAELGRLDLIKWTSKQKINPIYYSNEKDKYIKTKVVSNKPVQRFQGLCGALWGSIKSGNLTILKYLLSRGEVLCADHFEYAAEFDNITILEFLYEQKCEWNGHVIASAITNSHLDNVKWLFSKGCPWNYNAVSKAAKKGFIEILEIFKSYDIVFPDYILNEAVISGSIKTLEWLINEGCNMSATACAYAIKYKHTHILEWILSNHFPIDDRALDEMIKLDEPDCFEKVKNLIEKTKIKVDLPSCELAASIGNKKILKYLLQNGGFFNETLYEKAAESGHMKIINYLQKNKYPWSLETINYACLTNDIEFVSKIIDRGCPWDAKKCFKYHFLSTYDCDGSNDSSNHICYEFWNSESKKNRDMLIWLLDKIYGAKFIQDNKIHNMKPLEFQEFINSVSKYQ